jgi:hypothetical protein
MPSGRDSFRRNRVAPFPYFIISGDNWVVRSEAEGGMVQIGRGTPASLFNWAQGYGRVVDERGGQFENGRTGEFSARAAQNWV